MRNDARPIGPEADQSPLSEEHSRDVVNHERQEDRTVGRKPPERGPLDHLRSGYESDPTLPADDATLNTKI